MYIIDLGWGRVVSGGGERDEGRGDKEDNDVALSQLCFSVVGISIIKRVRESLQIE